MLKKYFYFIIFGLLALSTSCFAMSQEEEKAIQDWEIVQKSYPQTTKFEKLADKKYHFINTGIGYDGELILKNVIIDKSEYENTKSAEFMVKLEKSDKSFMEEENESYSRWNYKTNTLLLNPKKNTWVLYSDYTDTETTTSCSNSKKQKPVWQEILILAFVMFLVFFLSRILAKRNNQEPQTDFLQEALDSNRELINSNQQLAEVLDKILIQLSEKNDDKKEEKG